MLKPDRHFYCFTRADVYPVVYAAISRMFTVKSCLIWMKQNHGSGDLQADYSPQYEMIIFATKGSRPLRGKRASNVLHFDRVSSAFRMHPAQKPVDLLRFLIEKSTVPGEIVLDPFAGVGSTGVACKIDMLGQQEDYRPRSFLMIEKDQAYQKIGLQRIQLGGMAKEIRVFVD
jgi:site-specific DNA-methyltransferase (adenine-specific)